MSWEKDFYQGAISPVQDLSRSQAFVLGNRQAQLSRSPASGSEGAIGMVIIAAGCLWAVAAFFAGIAWLFAATPGWVWWSAATCLVLGAAWYLYPLIREDILLARVRRLRRENQERGFLKEQIAQLHLIAFRLDMAGNQAGADDARQEANQIEARHAKLLRGAKK